MKHTFFYHVVFIVVCIISIVVCFAWLGSWALMDFDEAIYGRVFHESIRRHNFWTFTLWGEPFLDKPPLYFWLTKLTTALWGEHEFALRFPSAFFTVVSLIMAWKISERLSGRQSIGLLSSLILASTALFMFAGRQVRLDIPVTASVLIALYGFIRGRDNARWFVVFVFGCIAAFLFKSFFALLLLPIIGIYSLVYRQWQYLKNPYFWLSLVVALLLVLPWHVYQFVLFGSAFLQSRYFSNVPNRLGAHEIIGEYATRSYHMGQLVVQSQPWFLLFIVLGFLWIFSLVFRKQKQVNPYVLFTFSVSCVLLILFLLPKNRLLYYFSLLFPFIAMFISGMIVSLSRGKSKALMVILVPLFCIAVYHTGIRLYTPNERDGFLRPIQKLSRYEIAEDEKKIGILMRSYPNVPIFLYRWQFFPTLVYYAGHDRMQKIEQLESVAVPSLLFLPTPLYTTKKEFFTNMSSRFMTVETLYLGPAGTLLSITKKPL